MKTRPDDNARFLDMRGSQINQFETNLHRFGLTADDGRYLNASEALFQQCVADIKAKIAGPWTDGKWIMSGLLELKKDHQKVNGMDEVSFRRQTAPEVTAKARALKATPVTVEITYRNNAFHKGFTTRETFFLSETMRWQAVWKDVEMRLLGPDLIEFRKRAKPSDEWIGEHSKQKLSVVAWREIAPGIDASVMDYDYRDGESLVIEIQFDDSGYDSALHMYDGFWYPIREIEITAAHDQKHTLIVRKRQR